VTDESTKSFIVTKVLKIEVQNVTESVTAEWYSNDDNGTYPAKHSKKGGGCQWNDVEETNTAARSYVSIRTMIGSSEGDITIRDRKTEHSFWDLWISC
jgi:hypothetical protein